MSDTPKWTSGFSQRQLTPEEIQERVREGLEAMARWRPPSPMVLSPREYALYKHHPDPDVRAAMGFM